jgi:hypothetical protein
LKGPDWVNLRHEHFVPTGPLNPKLPPLQMHPQAVAVRHKRPLAVNLKNPVQQDLIRSSLHKAQISGLFNALYSPLYERL